MVRIATEIEKTTMMAPWKAPAHVEIEPGDVTDAVSHATCDTAFDLRAAAILVATASGRTARDVAKYRPHALILAATPNATVERQLRLVWGVLPVHSRRAATSDQIIRDMVDLSVRHGLAHEGDRVVVTAGVATGMTGATNLMTVEMIKKYGEPTR
jgi:pyruvate kinase